MTNNIYNIAPKIQYLIFKVKVKTFNYTLMAIM